MIKKPHVMTHELLECSVKLCLNYVVILLFKSYESSNGNFTLIHFRIGDVMWSTWNILNRLQTLEQSLLDVNCCILKLICFIVLSFSVLSSHLYCVKSWGVVLGSKDGYSEIAIYFRHKTVLITNVCDFKTFL